MVFHKWLRCAPWLGVMLAVSALAQDGGAQTAKPPANGPDRPPAGRASEQPPPPAARGGALDFRAVKTLAIQEGGRKKALQTFAQESIEQLMGRPLFASAPSFRDPETKRRLGPVEMLLSLWFQTRDWDALPVVLVAYRPLRKELGLDEQKKRFSLNELRESKPLQHLVMQALKKRRAKRDKELTDLEKEGELVFQRLQLLRTLQDASTLNIVPHPSAKRGTWIPVELLFSMYLKPKETLAYFRDTRYGGDGEKAQALFDAYRHGFQPKQILNLLQKYRDFSQAYRRRDPSAFKEASEGFAQALRSLSPAVYPPPGALAREVSYDNLRPFGRAWPFYLAAALLSLLTLKLKSRAVRGVVWAFFLAGLAFHVYGFVLRCLIAGRPPVSNMYESVIWVGFGTVFFGLVFELKYRARYYLACGALGGFFCLVLMDLLPVVMGNSNLPGFEAKIGPLVPVLRDNFWLTVHVLTITLSYAAFALAWILGHVTLAKHLFQPAARTEHHQLHQFVYRVIQIGVLLLASGTILGGVWAYYSWGRFWGWDSKETWAFISLLCYLVVLHGRFTGWWGNFGLCVGSVVCFQAIVMSWYGVNFVLGSGLHGYGAGAGGLTYVAPLVGLDLAFTLAALIRYRTYRKGTGTKASAGAEAPSAALADHQLTATDPVDEERRVLSKSP